MAGSKALQIVLFPDGIYDISEVTSTYHVQTVNVAQALENGIRLVDKPGKIKESEDKLQNEEEPCKSVKASIGGEAIPKKEKGVDKAMKIQSTKDYTKKEYYTVLDESKFPIGTVVRYKFHESMVDDLMKVSAVNGNDTYIDKDAYYDRKEKYFKGYHVGIVTEKEHHEPEDGGGEIFVTEMFKDLVHGHATATVQRFDAKLAGSYNLEVVGQAEELQEFLEQFVFEK